MYFSTALQHNRCTVTASVLPRNGTTSVHASSASADPLLLRVARGEGERATWHRLDHHSIPFLSMKSVESLKST